MAGWKRRWRAAGLAWAALLGSMGGACSSSRSCDATATCAESETANGAGGDAAPGADGSLVDAGAGADASVDGDGPTATCGACAPSERCCGGACVDLSSDTQHCGACDAVCGSQHANAACEKGACILRCQVGHEDCDGKPENGCEADTFGDVTSCGACGNACTAVDATPTCSQGKCGFTCTQGRADCDGMPANGCEVVLATSATSCGACGHACVAAHATAGCASGACDVAACDSGWGDCDALPANGCEVDLTTTLTSCGACGRGCALAHATPTCTGGACAIAACDTGHLDCDALPANGCETVDPGAPSSPAPTAPWAGAYTGSVHASAKGTLRPTFAWRPATGGACVVTYEVQLNDSCAPGKLGSCAFPSPELDGQGVTTTSFTPAKDLAVATSAPVGRDYAWRVRACDVLARCSPWSVASLLHVGRVEGDVDGDGYGEIAAFSAPAMAGDGGGAWLDWGGSPWPTSRAATIRAGSKDDDGELLAFADVDADGLANVVLGGPTGVSTLPNPLPFPGCAFAAIASAGDWNGDGVDDVVVGATCGAGTPGSVAVYAGGAGAKSLALIQSLTPTGAPSTFGADVLGGFDADGDARPDVAVADDAGSVWVFTQAGARAAHDTSGTSGVARLARAGDQDGDGFDDVAVGVASANGGAGTLAIELGGATPLSRTRLTLAGGTGEHVGAAIAGGWDVDGDGRADLVVGGAPTPTTGTISDGEAFLARVATNSLARGTTQRGAKASSFAASVAARQDLDGDGVADVVVGAPTASAGGSVLVYLGASPSPWSLSRMRSNVGGRLSLGTVLAR